MLNGYGKMIWKHRRDKTLFAEKPYSWADRILLIEEKETRKLVGEMTAKDFDYRDWELMTHEEYSRVKYRFSEIYLPIP